MSHERPKCLFPIANIPLIQFQLELLAINNVNEVIVVTSKDTKILKEHTDKIRDAHRIGKKASLSIQLVKLQNPKNLCDAVR